MQISLFDGAKPYKIDKPIRLIELFGGYGSQHFALEYLGANFEQWKLCEWAVKSIQAYKDAHFKNDNTDYSKDLSHYQVVQYLLNKGISANYNEPMKENQIIHLGEEKARTIYNNIMATHNLVNIQQVKGKDLEIVDTDKYCYIMTYSFPCQDLSLAGLGKGMAKDSGTRSGMLWEVERILDEIATSNGNLPQVLLMENVPEVVGSKNVKHFAKWIEKLESLGYKCKWEILNAKDFGIPQNRERCFMISILGDYYYDFPQKTPLQLKLKDLLEKDVDEKYYLSDSKIKAIQNWKAQQDPLKDIDKEKLIAPTLTARGAGEEHSGMVLINEDVYNNNPNLKTKLCNKLIEENLVEEGDVVRHSYSTNRMNKFYASNKEHRECSPTLDTRCDCLGVVVNGEPIPCELRHDEGIRTFKDNIMGTLRTIDSCGDKHILEPKVIGGIGDKKSNGGTQWYQQDRIYDNNIAISVTTAFNLYYKDNLRIRKLTPKECFRLMGVRDNDFELIAENQSNASLYHLAGDSIVIDVLMAIFKQML